MIFTNKPPYIKGKGICFNPIVKYGIPAYADSKLNPKVKGTQAWREFWEEQLYYIRNGVQMGGMWIPGRFYYYMNFSVMGSLEKGVITPDMCDLHLELAYLIEHVKEQGKNLICAKGRRKGISEFTHKAVIDYGWRFTYGYKSGIVSGKKKYVEEFVSKWEFGEKYLPPELKVKHSGGNKITAGYEQKNEFGDWEMQGTQNIILSETVHTDPNPLKGYYFNDVVVEEVGETEKFEAFYGATKDSLMSGNIQKGTMFAYGTGGNIDKGSKGFKYAWEHPDEFNAIKFLVPATRFYFFGGADLPQRRLPIETDLYKKYKAFQLVGVEDYDLSEKDILHKREAARKSGNLKKYHEELQNNPLTEREIFRKTNANNFDLEKLNQQSAAITALPMPKYSKYKLEWVKDDKGMIKAERKVHIRPLIFGEDESDCVYIRDDGHPKPNWKHVFVAGIDSYDQDTSKTSKSLGAMCVMTREHSFSGLPKKVPVACIRTRPKRKEIFYDLCLKLAAYYDIRNNVLIDVRCPAIIPWFKDRGGEKYLAKRPSKFEKEDTTQGHDYGVSLNTYSKDLMVGVMQTHIYDYSNEIWFNSDLEVGPNLINELLDYDIQTLDSDNDLADAYGIALMQDISADVKPQDTYAHVEDDEWAMPEWTTDAHGNVVMKSDGINHDNPELDHNGLFG